MTTRRLAAILAADMVGYSRLMGADEEGTLARLQVLRSEVIDPAVAKSGGRIVKTTGDGILAEFPSAVEAVRCALEMQEQTRKREEARGPEQQIEFRIGINVGDVIASDDDIHGDGVNIAARLEALAEAGSILVSETVHATAAGRLACVFKDLGKRALKNIAQPVRVYQVAQAASAARPPLPDKPSLAVLPFQNMSGDSEQEYFADGIAEDIITLLSKARGLLVIARNSTFTYKGKAVDVNRVARELRVRYVLEGSVRKAGNRVRVTAQLIEVASGGHLWAERYDRDLVDIFGVQDEITGNVSAAILPAMERSERERAARKPPDSLDAWECYHRGLWHYAQLDAQQNERAREFFTRAMELDPGFAAAYSAIAVTYFTGATTFRPFDERSLLLPKAIEFAQRSIVLDKADAKGHAALAYTLVLLGRHEEARAESELAVAVDENSAWAFGAHGYALTFGGFPRKGIEALRMALRLSPFDPLVPRWQHHMARAYYFAEEYEAAISLAREVCRSHPGFRAVYRTLVAALGQIGKPADAQAVLSEAFERFGKDIFPPIGTRMPELRIEDYEKMVDGYRKAGIL